MRRFEAARRLLAEADDHCSGRKRLGLGREPSPVTVKVSTLQKPCSHGGQFRLIGHTADRAISSSASMIRELREEELSFVSAGGDG